MGGAAVMLKALVVLLALANLAFFAWTQGWIDGPTGIRARGDREPERLSQQFQPEVVQILPPQTARTTSAPAAAVPQRCPQRRRRCRRHPPAGVP